MVSTNDEEEIRDVCQLTVSSNTTAAPSEDTSLQSLQRQWNVGHVPIYLACCDKDPETFDSWYITSDGGVIYDWRTDDYLIVPSDAVPVGKRYRICCRVHTNTGDFQTADDSNNNYHHVAPVLEYHLHDNEEPWFQTHIQIVIRTLLDYNKINYNFMVRCRNDTSAPYDVLSESPHSEHYFKSDVRRKCVRIYTRHFTQFEILDHLNEKVPYGTLEILAFVKKFTIPGGQFTTAATLKLFFLKGLQQLEFNIKVCAKFLLFGFFIALSNSFFSLQAI